MEYNADIATSDKKPKTLRRKIKGFIKSDHNDLGCGKDVGWRRDAIGSVDVSHQFKEEFFKCRMLGECVLKSLKPADCYEFALRCANSFQHKHLPKGLLILYQDDFRLDFTNLSPDNKRKNNNNNKHSSNQQQQRPTTVFDDSFRHRSAALRCSYSTTGRPIFCIAGQSADGDALTPPDMSVPIHKVAYCGVIPERPEVFFVTSRDCAERLVCRVFVFSKRHKAREVKWGLALRFERAYREWQSQFSTTTTTAAGTGTGSSRSSIRSLISSATSTPGSSPYVRAKKHKQVKRMTKKRLLLHLSSSSK